jgi:hypothetical protein
MPRPYPPPSLSTPTVEPFVLESRDQARIAQTLGLDTLPSEIAAHVAHLIACFKATQDGSRDTSIANTLAALAELSRGGRDYMKVVSTFALERCGVDYTTLDRLQPLARAVLAGDPRARQALAEAARIRAAELSTHSRIAPKTEAFRFFCGCLRVTFAALASPATERSLRNCRRFALAVFLSAEIEHDFEAHPERLNEYLRTDVTTD